MAKDRQRGNSSLVPELELPPTSTRSMITRTQSKSVVFGHPFDLKGVDRILPPGQYKVVTDEQLICRFQFTDV
jgi:hypothetical protein